MVEIEIGRVGGAGVKGFNNPFKQNKQAMLNTAPCSPTYLDTLVDDIFSLREQCVILSSSITNMGGLSRPEEETKDGYSPKNFKYTWEHMHINFNQCSDIVRNSRLELYKIMYGNAPAIPDIPKDNDLQIVSQIQLNINSFLLLIEEIQNLKAFVGELYYPNNDIGKISEGLLDIQPESHLKIESQGSDHLLFFTFWSELSSSIYLVKSEINDIVMYIAAILAGQILKQEDSVAKH